MSIVREGVKGGERGGEKSPRGPLTPCAVRKKYVPVVSLDQAGFLQWNKRKTAITGSLGLELDPTNPHDALCMPASHKAYAS